MSGFLFTSYEKKIYCDLESVSARFAFLYSVATEHVSYMESTTHYNYIFRLNRILFLCFLRDSLTNSIVPRCALVHKKFHCVMKVSILEFQIA